MDEGSFPPPTHAPSAPPTGAGAYREKGSLKRGNFALRSSTLANPREVALRPRKQTNQQDCKCKKSSIPCQP